MADGIRRDVFRALKDQGWTVEPTNGGHIRCTSPEGTPVFTGSTPGDWRQMKSWICELRRHGFVWRARSKRKKEDKAA